MILRLFRRKGGRREDKQVKSSNNSSERVAGRETTSSNAERKKETLTTSTSKTVILAELVKVLANPSQLLELVRRSPIVYVGYVRDDNEIKSIVKRYGGKPLLLSIKGSSSFTHVIYFDGKFYTLVNGSVKVINKLVSSNNNVRVVVYKLE